MCFIFLTLREPGLNSGAVVNDLLIPSRGKLKSATPFTTDFIFRHEFPRPKNKNRELSACGTTGGATSALREMIFRDFQLFDFI
jgi:hypothetical protein